MLYSVDVGLNDDFRMARDFKGSCCRGLVDTLSWHLLGDAVMA